MNTFSETVPFSRSTARAALALVAAALVIGWSSPDAHAVSQRVKNACANDYFAYCSMHPVGSTKLRACMRANGPKLSKTCVNALIADGEVSTAEVGRKKARMRQAQSNN
jgi:hypothetical protein